MKNKQEFVGLITNIALVVLVFCFIVVGLNIIGIYSLPAPIEKILGTYDANLGGTSDNSDNTYGLISFEGEKSLNPIYLTYENADSILNNLQAPRNYFHIMTVSHFFGDKVRTEELQLVRNDGYFSVQIFDSVGNKVKSITEDDEYIAVTENYNGKENVVSLEKGVFSVSDECGFILTAEEFFDSGYNLTEADFVQSYKDGMSYITVSFDLINKDIVTHNVYEISLDLGVVTNVLCYENEILVYEMKTDNIG